MPDELPLSMDELRAVTAFAAESAEDVLELFEKARPDDPRPREAIEAAWAFAKGGKRGKLLRDCAWAAMRAGKDAETAGEPAAAEAARAALGAAGAAYLHPLPNATQVKHILGSAASAARAVELAGGEASLERATEWATPTVVDVLLRYPPAPAGGGRVGELIRQLDQALRG